MIKNNSPECVLVSVDEYMAMVNKINDMEVILETVDRTSDFNEELKDTFSQEEVEKMFGVNTNDYEEVEIE